MVIAGVPTTMPYHLLILESEAFKAGDVDTGFIVKHADELAKPLPSEKKVCAAIA
jgi:acetyl/propionyl-CoA carboxylase alpha subunit